MELIAVIRRFLEQHGIEPCPLLIAVSGGADSTALLLISESLRGDGFSIRAVHVNHHLRGAESDLDQDYVRALCGERDIPLHIVDGPLDARVLRERGLEAAAREVRYRLFEQVRDRSGSRYVVTAHHRDDQAETVLMRLITGSGIERLAGISPVSPTRVLRPLLEVPRSALLDFLQDLGIGGRFDSSNADERFLRNRIRHDLLPQLAQINPRISENLAALARQVRERSHAFESLFADASGKWLQRTANATEFELQTLPPQPWLRRAALWREITRLAPGTREVSSADLRRLTESFETLRRTTVSKDLEIVRTGANLTLRKIAAQSPPFTRILRPGAAVDVNGLTFQLERRGATAPPFTDHARSFQTFQLPQDATQDEFVVRNRRRGERFRPLGFASEKKLNEFLIDRKIPRELRDQLPLLTWQDEVVWVAGVEVSDKFKVSEPWRDAYRITIVRNEHSA
jgi:tRNA(Ile)-lysidine synthase